jgi:hypothetical protein
MDGLQSQSNKQTVVKQNKSFKTTISCSESMCDENGQVIPNGNYYFTITEHDDTYCKGSLTSKGEYGDFVFKHIDVIKMMSVAQSRLARRAGLVEKGMPNYKSPPISPENHQLKQLNQEDVVYNYFYTPDQCAICLNMISQEKKRLNCNHCFHNNCILKWLERDNRCPICRKIEPLQQQQQPQNTDSNQTDHLTSNVDRPRASSYSHPTTQQTTTPNSTNRQNLPNINLRRRYNNYIVPLNNYVDPQAKNRIHK